MADPVRVQRVESFQTSGPPATLTIGHVHPDDLARAIRREMAAEIETIRDDLRKGIDVDDALRWSHDRLTAPAPREPAQERDGAPAAFVMRAHLQRQREWSERTFGPGARAAGVIDHIRKELREIEAAPGDLEEWIDVVILALDGAWRSGASPDQIIAQLVGKQTKNEARKWPDWRTMSPDKAIEHEPAQERQDDEAPTPAVVAAAERLAKMPTPTPTPDPLLPGLRAALDIVESAIDEGCTTPSALQTLRAEIARREGG